MLFLRLGSLLLAFFAVAAAQQSGVHLIVLPSESPMITQEDKWQCATKDIVGYFEPPIPTGNLATARRQYGDLIQTCTYTGAKAFDCPFPEKSLWCGFSTAVPPSLLDEYISYGSTASSWWSARSSAAVSIAQECPQSWWTARDRVSFGANRLNLTIIEADCYADAHVTGTEPSPTTTVSGSMPRLTSPSPTSRTGQQNAGLKRAENTAAWMAAGTCLAAGAVNSVL